MHLENVPVDWRIYFAALVLFGWYIHNSSQAISVYDFMGNEPHYLSSTREEIDTTMVLTLKGTTTGKLI